MTYQTKNANTNTNINATNVATDLATTLTITVVVVATTIAVAAYRANDLKVTLFTTSSDRAIVIDPYKKYHHVL
jgi:hypothetical protein